MALKGLQRAIPALLVALSFSEAASATDLPNHDSATASTLDQAVQYSTGQNSVGQDNVIQHPSVSELSDVQPTDWAYQALQSLVERYSCIAGLPNATYQGNRALTRSEFAAGLNACLDRIGELIVSSTADLATQEDLAILQRLQADFAAELATLRGRVESLESWAAELEANQFSTTTTLEGEAILIAGMPIAQDRQAFPQDQAIAGYELTLSLNTSFTGEDLLNASLKSTSFTNFASFGDTVEWNITADAEDEESRIQLDQLFYTFPVSDRVTVTIAGTGVSDSDWVISTVSPLDTEAQGAVTSFVTPAQYNYIPGGTGVGFSLGLANGLTLDAAYAAEEADNSTPGSGLFNGDYGIITQLTYLSDRFSAALTYANGYTAEGFINDDNPEVANTYGAQVNFAISDRLQIGGGIAYVPIRTLGKGDYTVWSYQGTIALPDFGREGNLLGIVFGVPPRATGFGNGLLPITEVRNQDMSFVIEGFYQIQLNDNLSVTPGLVWISNPGNDHANGDTFAGAMTATFSF